SAVQELTTKCQSAASGTAPSAVQELTTECQSAATSAAAAPERWILCRSAGCRRKEQPIFAARLAQARQRLAPLQTPVVAGTFTTQTVIRGKAQKAVGRTHDLQGIFTCARQRSTTGQQWQTDA